MIGWPLPQPRAWWNSSILQARHVLDTQDCTILGVHFLFDTRCLDILKSDNFINKHNTS